MTSSEAVTVATAQSRERGQPFEADYDQIADYLTDGYWEWTGGPRHAFDVAPGGTLTADITALNLNGQQLARWALEAWTNVTGINFRFVESDADITFDDAEEGAFASTVWLGNQTISSHVNVSAGWLDAYGSTIDSYSFSTYIHEIGHALGLGHPGPYPADSSNPAATYGIDNIFPSDSWQATVMSYFSQADNTYIDASYAYVVTPMIADIIAIQDLYGVPTDINAGDTVYGYQSNLDGYLGQLSAQVTGERNDPEIYRGEAVTLTLYDTGGRDTLDLRTDTADQRVDLRPESISDVYGLVGNLSIARDTLIENFIAGSGNDKVIGNATANQLEGRAGNDTLDGGPGADLLNGGSGTDTVSYARSDSGVVVSLASGTAWRGHAAGDTIIDIENLEGSSYADRLMGDNAANSLRGRAGNDTLEGRAGDDTLDGGAGADLLNGGRGTDTVSYARSDSEVVVSLASNTAYRGHAAGDTIVDIENLEGSSYADRLLGDNAANSLRGRAGNDTLAGRAGDDILDGGSGADLLNGGRGTDTVSYARSDSEVVVSLASGTAYRGHAAGATIVDIENLEGSSYADRLLGDNAANSLWGRAGNDTLSGRAGDDTLDGGPGADLLNGGRGTDTFVFHFDDGDDTISDFTDGEDRIDLSEFDLSGFAALNISTDPAGVMIDLSAEGGGTILLENFDMSDLDAGDFLFA